MNHEHTFGEELVAVAVLAFFGVTIVAQPYFECHIREYGQWP